MKKAPYFRHTFAPGATSAAATVTLLGLNSGTTFTQTYSTGNATVAAPTAAAPAAATSNTITDNTGGTASTSSMANLADGSTYATDHPTIENNFATIAAELVLIRADIAAVRAEVVKLVADNLDNRQSITSIIDALQAVGIAG